MSFSKPEFLERFDEMRQSQIGNLFFAAVREGVRSPADVLLRVAEMARGEAVFANNLVAALDRYRGEALAYASQAITREAMSDSERQAEKAERQGHFRAAYLERQTATEKQVAFLRKLGYEGPAPSSRKEASSLIDELLAAKG